MPVVGVVDIDIGLCGLEVVDVGRSGLAHVTRVARNEVRKLAVDSQRRRLCRGHPGDFVQQVRQPHKLRLVAAVQSPNGITQRLHTRVHFRRQRAFAEVHDSTAEHKVLAELVLQMRANQRFSLHREGGLVLQLDVHIGSGVQNRLVQDSHRSHRVVHRIVHVFSQFGSTCRHGHAASRHIHRAQLDLAAVRALVLALQSELVLLAHLLCNHQRRVVQFLEHIFVCNPVIANRSPQAAAERFEQREDDSAVT